MGVYPVAAGDEFVHHSLASGVMDIRIIPSYRRFISIHIDSVLQLLSKSFYGCKDLGVG